MNIVKWEEQGINIPVLCLQCKDPFCMKVCPSDALKRNEKTGAITIDYAVCSGCKLCVMICPIGGIVLDPVERKIVKCELCDGDPYCVRFCVTKALKYEKTERLAIAARRKGIEKYGNLLSKIVLPSATGGT